MGKRFDEFLRTGFVSFKTGGTTETQKEIKKSIENMMAESYDLQSEFNFEGELEFITTTTDEHLFGFTFYQMLPYVHKFKINPNKINYPEDINIKNSVLITTPSFIEAMRKYSVKPVIKPKIIITAGAKLEDKTFEYALEISEKVIEIYGSTETGIIGYRTSPNTKRFKLFKGIKILEAGESYTKIDTKYSYDSPVIIEDRIKNCNGEIEFYSRQGRVLKIQEKRVQADEIELKLKQSEFIENAYCFEYGGKLAVLGVLTNQGKDFLLNNDKISLIKVLKSTLIPTFEIIPQKWKFFDEIPCKQNGKIDKIFIQELFNLNLSLPLILKREIQKDSAKFEICFLKNSNFFKGHFENFPIVAGVVQLFYAGFFAKIAFGENFTSGQIRRIKFSNIIKPQTILTLELNKNKNNIDYKYYSDITYSTGALPLENFFSSTIS